MRFFKLILLCCIALVNGYPEGAPGCKTDVPSHEGAEAKSGKSPYTIVAAAPKTASNGDKSVVVTVTGGKSSFKGFHLTARAPNSATNIGKFTAPSNAKVLKCSPTSNAITHKDNNDKSSISFTWTAPKKYKGKVEFRATIVKNFKEFYTNVRSAQVTI